MKERSPDIPRLCLNDQKTSENTGMQEKLADRLLRLQSLVTFILDQKRKVGTSRAVNESLGPDS